MTFSDAGFLGVFKGLDPYMQESLFSYDVSYVKVQDYQSCTEHTHACIFLCCTHAAHKHACPYLYAHRYAPTHTGQTDVTLRPTMQNTSFVLRKWEISWFSYSFI